MFGSFIIVKEFTFTENSRSPKLYNIHCCVVYE